MNVKIEYRCGKEYEKYDCFLCDDGSLDTIIEVKDLQHRILEVDRKEDGSIAKETFINLCQDTIETDEIHWS